MGLIASENGGGSYSPIPAGLHHAVCIGVCDLGTHYSEKFNKRAHKCAITWEIPEERIEIERDGKMLNLPRVTTKTYTVSLHERSSLRKDLDSWRGRPFTTEELKGFDLKNVLGANCMIQIVHTSRDGKIYANPAAITSVPKGFQKINPESATYVFDLDSNTPIPEQVPQWLRDQITASDEYRAMQQNGGAGYYPDDKAPGFPDDGHGMDDVPF